MDRPWRVVAIAALLVLCGTGYVIWLERDRIVDLFEEPGHATLKRSELPGALSSILLHTGADLDGVWSIDLGANAAYFEQGRKKGGGAWTFEPTRLPAIVESTNVKNLIQVLKGHAICDGRGNLGSLLVRQLVDEGMQRVCIVPIPPDPQVLVGILLLAWRTAPDAAQEDQAVGAALEVAGGLVTRWQK